MKPTPVVTPSQVTLMAEQLRRVDVAAEDVDTVMKAASMLEVLGDELARVIHNRDRILKNRNNKQGQLKEMRARIAELNALLERLPDGEVMSQVRAILKDVA